eukprot:12419792-Karenia_brevis.AAC.1
MCGYSAGKELQERWSGEGAPPLHQKPPLKGGPKLERTHPFHFKMTPGIMLGARCNHDLGMVPKLPVLTDSSVEGRGSDVHTETQQQADFFLLSLIMKPTIG